MSSVIENQTLLTGRVRSREPHVSTERWDVLHLDVSAAADVAGAPNLLGESVGHDLAVAVNRDELPEGDLSGYQFTGPVRLAGPETVLALPAGSGAPPPELVPPTPTGEGTRAGDSNQPADEPAHPRDAKPSEPAGDPPPAGQWPTGDAGPRPVL
ncbi:MAG: hypothetical protein ABIZ07_08450 [Dermatophilaceae bacterium]